MEPRRKVAAVTSVVLVCLMSQGEAFTLRSTGPMLSLVNLSSRNTRRTTLNLSDDNASNEQDIKFSRPKIDSLTNLDEQDKPTRDDDQAATSTVNERLLAELKTAENKEKFGAKSSYGKKMGLVDGYGRSRKTDEEVQASLERARDLNGVNPVVSVLGSFFALGVAALLWYATGKLGIFFTLHPVDSEVYFVTRSAQVVRNIAMGLISLASGFFGVTGLGILGMGIRVSYGVMTGELDPTPIKQNQVKPDMPNVWDLMMNKKPGRRGGGK
jgi:hypothetical protein